MGETIEVTPGVVQDAEHFERERERVRSTKRRELAEAVAEDDYFECWRITQHATEEQLEFLEDALLGERLRDNTRHFLETLSKYRALAPDVPIDMRWPRKSF